MSVIFRNNATSTLADDIGPEQTLLAVREGDAWLFPQPISGQWFPVTLIDRGGNLEIVHCTGREDAVLNVERGKEGTTARVFPASSVVSHRMTAESLSALVVAGVIAGDTPPLPPLQNGQLWWDSDSGALFIWYDDGDSAQWVQVGGGGGGGSGGGSAVFVSDTPPSPPLHNGQLWWKANTGNLYLWYADIDSEQWVQINSAVSGGGSGGEGTGVPTIADAAAASFLPSTLVIETQSYSAVPIRGGARYRRDTLAGVSGHPARAWFRSVDRYMPDGSTDATNGGYWLLQETKVSPFMFGAVGDGIADDVIAINEAISYLYQRSKSGEVDLSRGRWLVDSANVLIKSGISLVGSVRNAGTVAGTSGVGSRDWSAVKSAVVLNPLYTIMFTGDGCAVQGLNILRKNMTVPSTERQAIDEAKAFAGTAITNADPTATGNPCDENYVGHCFIAGFQYAYRDAILSTGRIWIEYVQGDCTNGIWMQYSYDMQHLSHCHFWPHVTAGIAMLDYVVSNMVNNGSGLIRVTIPTHVLVTGDIINITSVTGTSEARGRWTVTVINDTTIDLQGSAFVNTYVSGGNVRLYPGARHGVGFAFAETIEWGQADNCFCYGYDVGFDINHSSPTVLVNCGVDHYATAQDRTTVGIRVTNTPRCHLMGCRTAAAGTGVLVDVGNGLGNTVSISEHTAWGTIVNGIEVRSGYAQISGALLHNTATGILVGPTSDGVYVQGNAVTSLVTTPLAISGAALEKSTVGSNNWFEASPGLIGHRQVITGNAQRNWYWTEYSDTATGSSLVFRKARGTPDVPVVASSSDRVMLLQGQVWDGVDTYRTVGSIRLQASAAVSPTSSPGIFVWNVCPTGSVAGQETLALSATALYPLINTTVQLGSTGARWTSVYSTTMNITDGVTAPATSAGSAQIYVDSADGDLKVKFGDGIIKTLAVDT